MHMDTIYMAMQIISVIGTISGLVLLSTMKDKSFGTLICILSVGLFIMCALVLVNSYNYSVNGTITDKIVLQNNNALKLDGEWYFTDDPREYLYTNIGDNVTLDVFERQTAAGTIKQIKYISRRQLL